ncbi:MAG: DUF3237 domain-containing protein [Clostridium sp.]|nr:DUF3237 domain-containing protein [Clostridium sp.]
MRRILVLAAAVAAVLWAWAGDEAPALEFVMELQVEIGEAITVGDMGAGNRTIIPITGGTFSGPKIRGRVLSGGADYQVYDAEHRRNNLEAVYCIQAEDGENIIVTNRGIATDDYFCTTPRFEASYEGSCGWLNDGVYVCKPSGFRPGCISLKVWRVM